MTTLQEAMNVIKSLRARYKKSNKKKTKIADQLLGAFKGAIPEGKTSTQYIRELRDSSYGKFK